MSMFETKIGRATDGTWAFAIYDFLTGRCIASEAGFGSAGFARDAANDAKRSLGK